ncbi:hypothetical protein [uncultured Photobacterium sp.]|uniref:hypothetical protein n=1 Tax=uncultured Photobacterium sp. TaxID=173973 RepID=UPI00262DF03A|nr:hypothetical protein [uncultured Photobacterium sp.]
MIYNDQLEKQICKQRVRASIGKIEAQRKKPKYKCLVNGCSEFAIGSHSQQMGGQLKVIAENNKVTCLRRNLYDLYQDDYNGKAKLQEQHISNVSVFPGYCNHHDTNVFWCIEKEPLTVHDTMQSATFFLRAISHEFAQKRTFFDANKKMINMCKNFFNPRYIQLVKQMQIGREKFLENDGLYYLKKASKSVTDGHQISTVWVQIDKVLPASICTVFSPYRTYDDKMENWLYGNPQVMCSFNLVPTDDSTHIVISWLVEHESECAWLYELESNNELLEATVNEITLCDSEDICFKPSFWESIDIFTKEDIISAFHHESARGPMPRIPMVLKI